MEGGHVGMCLWYEALRFDISIFTGCSSAIAVKRRGGCSE